MLLLASLVAFYLVSTSARSPQAMRTVGKAQ
jgi:hypothetical protein